MKKIGIFYGPHGGKTQKISELIANKLGSNTCDLYPVKDVSLETLLQYDRLIFGIASLDSETWQGKKDKSQWEPMLLQLSKQNLSGKTVAIFGLGDQVQWPNHFVDSIGSLYSLLTKQGAKVVGQVSAEGYTFTDSAAFVNGIFVGLPIDEQNQPEKTVERVEKWVELIQNQM